MYVHLIDCVCFRLHVSWHWRRTSTSLNILWNLYIHIAVHKQNYTYINLNIKCSAFPYSYIWIYLCIYLGYSSDCGREVNPVLYATNMPAHREVARCWLPTKAEIRTEILFDTTARSNQHVRVAQWWVTTYPNNYFNITVYIHYYISLI